MLETTHGDVLAISDDDGVTLVGANHDSVALTKDQLIAIAAAHAARWPEPQLGRSIYRSVDAHLIAQQEVTRGALDESLRLRAELAALRADGAVSLNRAEREIAEGWAESVEGEWGPFFAPEDAAQIALRDKLKGEA